MRLPPANSVFLGNPHPQPVERFGERDLARQARARIAVIARIEQIVLVRSHRRQQRQEFVVHVDVARGARTAPAAQRQQFIEAIVADGLHHRKPGLGLDFAGFSGARSDDQLGHRERFLSGAGLLGLLPLVWQAERPVRQEDIVAGLDAVAARDATIAAMLARAGYPGPRLRERGYRTLLRTIVGQQVSVAAAASVWTKLEA